MRAEQRTHPNGPHDLELVTLDAPGHGSQSAVHADVAAGARLVGRQGGRATYVGYSMGGRLCLRLAVDHPHLVERLVLIGASPGIDDERARARRRADDEHLAQRLEQLGLERFLDEWLAQPLFRSLPTSSADRAGRLGNTVAGLAASLRLAGTGAQAPLWHRLGELSMPVLLLVGALDDKFGEIAERMAHAIPGATLERIAGAGHAAHLERPNETARVVLRWIAAQPPAANPAANITP